MIFIENNLENSDPGHSWFHFVGLIWADHVMFFAVERGPAAMGNRVHLVEGESAVRVTSALFSMFVTTMFFCLLVISYRVYKLKERQNYTRLRDMDGGH